MSKVIKVQDDVYDAICKYGEGKVGAGVKKLLEIAEGNEGNEGKSSAEKEITLTDGVVISYDDYDRVEPILKSKARRSDDSFFDGWESTMFLENEEEQSGGPLMLVCFDENTYGVIHFKQPKICKYKEYEDGPRQ